MWVVCPGSTRQSCERLLAKQFREAAHLSWIYMLRWFGVAPLHACNRSMYFRVMATNLGSAEKKQMVSSTTKKDVNCDQIAWASRLKDQVSQLESIFLLKSLEKVLQLQAVL